MLSCNGCGRHTPDLYFLDLHSSGGALTSRALSISLCSDGIWDNWKFEDVAEFLHHPDRMKHSMQTGSAQRCSEELMAANLARAQVNFGSSADNMTAVVLYMLPQAWAAAAR